MVYCCESFAHQITRQCETHNTFDCPDQLIVTTDDSDGRGYGLPIRDGGTSYVKINFCPWCGAELT